MNPRDFLPVDWERSTLLGRVQTAEGPTPVVIADGKVFDVSRIAPTSADFIASWEGRLPSKAPVLAEVSSLQFYTDWDSASRQPHLTLLAPVDLQCIKAAGVTFAVSALERVIEERARGKADGAQAIRDALSKRVGADLHTVRPGTPEAARLKQLLIADGLWSQYLEVAIGPDAEVFTKAPVLASVGWGTLIGVRADSAWNNPEPEVVLVCNSRGEVKGATLGNDVNLRDIEGRSALLLGKAKDNNASCAIGPFVRLLDDTFTLDDIRRAVISLEVVGEDGFRLHGESSMAAISRDPLELAAQTLSSHHQYPDGFALFLGTMFAPVEDRDTPGHGFTHKQGDIVRVSTPSLGMLENKVTTCAAAPPWSFGISALMRNLAARGLLNGPAA